MIDQATINRAVDAAQGVSAFDRAVYQQIASYAFSEAVCWPAQQTIADDLGLPAKSGRQRVSRSVGRLERAGWLSIAARPRGRFGWWHNVYELLHAWSAVPGWVRDHIVARAQKRVFAAVRTNSERKTAKVLADWTAPTLRDVMSAIASWARGASP